MRESYKILKFWPPRSRQGNSAVKSIMMQGRRK
ncbi:hypothetical protein Pan258_05160 [Symmachiella dynata]|uniref:Uncharacterized protein n=1 Tax=Symmachiella dynata TaxID=2527995 RepID=A0A517ZHS0_9PLAN|nr:hypothetical protein Pan258_05160 [Symmachiella dynata]QDU42002.1 hypothetical protein Mal52_04570 [Symmachiella dynata]